MFVDIPLSKPETTSRTIGVLLKASLYYKAHIKKVFTALNNKYIKI